jgi:hypothetical protein
MIADELLNTAARLLLRTCRPLQAHAVLMQLGRVFPAHRTRAKMRLIASQLHPRGTCLSRSLAIVARAPTAAVVIAVQPLDGATLTAHAWVEFDGEPLDPSEPTGSEIARLPGRSGPRVNSEATPGTGTTTGPVCDLSTTPRQC